MKPKKLNLEFDRKQAKALLRDVKSSQPEALARFEKHHPRGVFLTPKLADAQTVIARENGFPSWSQWKAFIETRNLDRKKQVEFATRASCSNDLRRARTLLDTDPSLAQEDPFLACAYGEPKVVQKTIQHDSGWVNRKGGVNDWEPLQYACFSRWLRADPERASRIVEVARILLQSGADPNAHHMEEFDGQPWRQCVIYGASGIANHAELTRLLLEAGADVNELKGSPDSDDPNISWATETLYHTAEFTDTRCLELVLAAKPHPKAVSYCLFRALDHENVRAVRLFLQAGADPNARIPHIHNSTPLHFALLRGRSAPFFQMLIEAGADLSLMNDEGLTPYRMAVRYGRSDLFPLFQANVPGEATEEDRTLSDLMQGKPMRGPVSIPKELVGEVLRRKEYQTLDALSAAGADLNGDEGDFPPLHGPAWSGDFAGVKAMVERGADIHRLNPYGGDALGATIHGSENCFDVHGGPGMRLPEEAHPGEYPEIAEYLIRRGAKLPKVIWGGSSAMRELLRKHGVPDPEE